jgi:hypothetical protein
MRGSYQCCICENNFSGYGHNPQPIDDTEGARCCDRCNSSVVIPARLKNYILGSESSDKEDAWGLEKSSAILAGVFGIALEGLLNRLEDSVVDLMSGEDKPHEVAYYTDCIDYLCSGMADTLEANSEEMDPAIVGSIVSMLTMTAVKISSYEQIPEIKMAMDHLDSDSEESSDAIAEIVAEETNEFGESLDIDMWSAEGSGKIDKCPVCEGTQVLEQMEMKTSDLCLGHSDAFDDLNLDVPYAAEDSEECSTEGCENEAGYFDKAKTIPIPKGICKRCFIRPINPETAQELRVMRRQENSYRAEEDEEKDLDIDRSSVTRRESIRESPEYYVHSLDEYFGPYYSIEDAEDGVERLVSKGIYIIGITKGQNEWIQDLTEQEAESFGSEGQVSSCSGNVYLDDWDFDYEGFDNKKQININDPNLDIEDVVSPDIKATICCSSSGECQEQIFDIDQVLEIIYEKELSLNDLAKAGVMEEILEEMGLNWDEEIGYSAESYQGQIGDIESISRWMRNTANAGTDYDDWYWDGEKLMVYAVDPIAGIDTEEEYTKADLMELGVLEDMFPNMDEFSEGEEFSAETIEKFFEQIEALLNKTAGNSWSLDSDGYPEENPPKVNINISMEPESPEFFEGL